MDKRDFERQKQRREAERRRRERGKTITIIGLTLLFVAQIALSGMLSSLPSLSNLFDQLLVRGGETTAPRTSQYTAAASPVRLSLRVADGRYSVEYVGDLGRQGSQSAELLREAVASLREPELVRQGAYELAYSMPGIWFDFLGVIPLYTVISWSESIPNEPVLQAEISSLLLISSDEAVFLYFADQTSGNYYRAKTDVRAANINQLLESTEPNQVTFAFETPGYESLHRETLISSTPPEPEVFLPEHTLTGARLDNLLSAVSFYGQSSYTSSGYSVYREGGDELRITEGGDVYYTTDGNSPRYTHPATTAAAIETTRRLAADALAVDNGAVRLQLYSVEDAEEGGTAIYYVYSINGAQVFLGTTGYAARFVVENGEITEYILRPRSFTRTDLTSLVLPLPQAIAALGVVNDGGGAPLELVYRVQEDGSLQADWETRLALPAKN